MTERDRNKNLLGNGSTNDVNIAVEGKGSQMVMMMRERERESSQNEEIGQLLIFELNLKWKTFCWSPIPKWNFEFAQNGFNEQD